MPLYHTNDDVFTLSTDERVKKRAVATAKASLWAELQSSAVAISGYFADDSGMGFKTKLGLQDKYWDCTCGAPDMPCKHILGLGLLWIEHPSLFTGTPISIDAPSEPEHTLPIPAVAPPVVKPSEAIEVNPERMKNMAIGIRELDQWLEQIAYTGIAALLEENEDYWDRLARRMTDAQMTGLFLRIKQMAQIKASDPTVDMLFQIGQLQLISSIFKQYEQLSKDWQYEIVQQLGVPFKKKDILAKCKSWSDQWIPMGSVSGVGVDGIRYRRYWFYGVRSSQYGVEVLYDPLYNTPWPTDWTVGGMRIFTAAYYPGVCNWRIALDAIGERLDGKQEQPTATESCEQMLTEYAGVLSQNPLVAQVPVFLNARISPPLPSGTWLVDQQDNKIPLSNTFDQCQWLFASAAGTTVQVFGEWNGSAYLALSIWINGVGYAC